MDDPSEPRLRWSAMFIRRRAWVGRSDDAAGTSRGSASTSRRLASALALTVALASSASTAWGQTTAGGGQAVAGDDPARGRQAVDCDAAIPELRRSYAAHPDADTLLALALCEEQKGFLGSALSIFGALSRGLPVGDARRAVASEHLAALDARVPHLRLVAPPGAPVAGAEVLLDGVPVPLSSLGTARATDPGEHVLETRIPGAAPLRERVAVAEGRQLDVPIRWPTPPPAPAKPLPQPWGSNARRTAAWLDFEVLSVQHRTGIAPALGASIGLGTRSPELVYLDLEAPFAIVTGGSGTARTGATLGNLSVGVHVAFGPRNVVGGVGLRVGIPTAMLLSSSENLLDTLMWSGGGYDLARYMPAEPISVPVWAEFLVEPFAFRLEGAAAVFIVGAGAGQVIPVVVEGAAEVAARARFGLYGGARFQAIAWPTSESRKLPAILGLGPFLGFDDRELFARASMLIPVANSGWYGWDDEHALAVRVSGGMYF